MRRATITIEVSVSCSEVTPYLIEGHLDELVRRFTRDAYCTGDDRIIYGEDYEPHAADVEVHVAIKRE